MKKRTLSAIALVVALGAPLAATPAAAQEHRVYDRQHRDYHNWNADEDRAYRDYLAQQHRKYRDFSRLKQKQQREYWRWRHEQEGRRS